MAHVEGGVAVGSCLLELLSQEVAHTDEHRALAFDVKQAIGRIGIDVDVGGVFIDGGDYKVANALGRRFALFATSNKDSGDLILVFAMLIVVVEEFVGVGASVGYFGNEF